MMTSFDGLEAKSLVPGCESCETKNESDLLEAVNCLMVLNFTGGRLLDLRSAALLRLLLGFLVHPAPTENDKVVPHHLVILPLARRR